MRCRVVCIFRRHYRVHFRSCRSSRSFGLAPSFPLVCLRSYLLSCLFAMSWRESFFVVVIAEYIFAFAIAVVTSLRRSLSCVLANVRCRVGLRFRGGYLGCRHPLVHIFAIVACPCRLWSHVPLSFTVVLYPRRS